MGHEIRQYETTHPWINFKLNLEKAPKRLWLDLGEVKSKCDHIGKAILRPDTAENLHLIFLAKGTAATTAIEGNTLSEEEVLDVVKGDLELPDSQAYLKQEVENILDACNLIKNRLHEGNEADLSLKSILDYHRLVLRDLPLESDVVPGETRKYSVVVGSYRGAPQEDCDFLIQKLCEWQKGLARDDPTWKIPLAVIRAIVTHIYVAWIHPFGDGNGRTARLIEFRILLEGGLPTATAQLLSNFYNRTRAEYYLNLQKASEASDPMPFLVYAIRGLLDELQGAIQLLWKQQYKDRWEQFIYETLDNRTSRAVSRRIKLILDLSRHYWDTDEPVMTQDIRHLSPRLAEAYAGKTQKTLSRDLHDLEDKKLITRTEGAVRPNIGVLLGFGLQSDNAV